MGKPVLDSCVIANNTITAHGGAGGGVYVTQASLEIRDCSIVDNEGTYGGGIALTDGAEMTMIRSEIMGNTAQSGGGVYLSNTGSSYSALRYRSQQYSEITQQAVVVV